MKNYLVFELTKYCNTINDNIKEKKKKTKETKSTEVIVNMTSIQINNGQTIVIIP